MARTVRWGRCAILSKGLGVALGMLAGVSLWGQSYQTSFAGEQFDRSKSPATIHSGVEVDGPTGAVSFRIPLGPGIGSRGITFQPALSGRVSPTVDGSSKWNGANGTWTHSSRTVPEKPYSLSPGVFELGLSNEILGEDSEGDQVVSNFTLPDGSSGSIGIAGWGQRPAITPLPTDADLARMLGLFGYATGTTYGTVPWLDGYPQSSPFIARGSNGALIVGLQPYVTARNTIYGNTNEGALSAGYWHFPQRLLVVRGEVAFEYAYVSPNYRLTTDTLAVPAPISNSVLRSGHYRLSRILNRFGEAVAFAYGTDGVSYTATWMQGVASGNPGTSTGVSIQVSATWGAIISGYGDVTFGLSYQGVNDAPSFTLTGTTYSTWPSVVSENDPLTGLRPGQLTVGTSGEQVTFGYGSVPAAAGPEFGANYTNPVLTSVTFPNRAISLAWTPVLYIKNMASSWSWSGYIGNWNPNFPTWFWGVTRVDDLDQVTGVTYTTTHTRKTPQADYSAPVVNGPIPWASTEFYDAITHPDGSVTVNRFAEPCLATYGGPSSTLDQQMQTVAHLKHLTTEIRHYTPSSASAWQSELGQSASQCSAFKVEVFDRWDLRSPANPLGEFNSTSVAAPTRKRVWERETGILQTEERTGWDATGLGWQATHQQSAIQAAPDLTRPDQSAGSTNLRSRACTGSSPSYPETAQAIYRMATQAFDSNYQQWFLSRPAEAHTTIQQDGTGNTTSALPANLPPTKKAFDATFNRITGVAVGEDAGPKVTTAFTYGNDSGGLPAAELSSVNVTGTMDLTVPAGGIGISAYGYDALGFMSSIQPKGVNWTLGQSTDKLGRPVTQTDANGLQTSYGRDGAGRLSSITPTDNAQPTSLAYNDIDHRGVTVTRGAQKTEYRYSGLGQLLLIRRWDSTVSYKAFGYDMAGRKTFESVWIAGQGSDAAGMSNAGLVGDRFVYDGQGRVIQHTDPNGRITSTTYNGLNRTVTVGNVTPPMTTTYTMDASRRLVQVTDAKNQLTKYSYHANGSIAEVKQYNQSQTLSQSRLWAYHPLGWLSQLVQPESGTTTYDQFTVGGKPQRTTYSGDGSGPARIVTTTFGSLERAVSVSSSDGSVSQSFVYDASPAGGRAASEFGKANGQMVYAQDKGVEVFRVFNGMGGALSALDTRVWTGGALNSGTSALFPQAFGYDGYGNRVQAAAGHSSVDTTFDLAKGLPKLLMRNQANVVTASFYEDSWNISGLTYGNQASSAFSYDADQTRLHAMTHGVQGGTSPTQWTYSYDSAGRMTGDLEDAYEYDELGRMTKATVKRLNNQGTVIQVLAYDAFGNATSSVATGNVPSAGSTGYNINNFTFNATEQAALAARNRIPTTASGVPTGAQYDALGNLTQIFHLASSSGLPVSLAYDALGRVTQMWDNATGLSEKYAYTTEGLRTVVEEYQSGVLQKRRYNVYNDARQLVTQYEATVTALALAKTSKTSAFAPMAILREPAGADIIAPTNNATVTKGLPVNFSGETDFGKTLTWSWGDGTANGSGRTATHTYATAGTYTVRFTASATGYTTSSATITLNVTATQTVPGITDFTASGTTLTWNVTGATSIVIDPGIGNVGASGSLAVTPRATTTYKLTATNALGTSTATATVIVEPMGLTWKRDFIYLGTKEVAEFDATGIHVTQVDHLGSSRIITNASGIPESTQKFLPFGETLDRLGSWQTGKGFTNHEQTGPSGLIYMQARFYVPQYHRFASPDPAQDQHFEETQSWNIYSYVQNNPVMNVDTTGMLKFKSMEEGLVDRFEETSKEQSLQTATTTNATGNSTTTATFPGMLAPAANSLPSLTIPNPFAMSQDFLSGNLTTTEPKITFSQGTGEYRAVGEVFGIKFDSNIGTGWSGRGDGKNNPSAQGVSDTGPLPRGNYTIGQPFNYKGVTGDYSMRLTPSSSNQMLNRSGFLIHGPSMDPKKYGQESKGCPILNRSGREQIHSLGITRFEVIQ